MIDPDVDYINCLFAISLGIPTKFFLTIGATMHFWIKLLLASLSSTVPAVLGQHVVNLSGDGWTVSSKALNITVPGHLPSQVHLDLLAANAISEFFMPSVCEPTLITVTADPLV